MGLRLVTAAMLEEAPCGWTAHHRRRMRSAPTRAFSRRRRRRLLGPPDGLRQGGHVEAQDLLVETVGASRSLAIACHSPRLAGLAGIILPRGDLFLRGFIVGDVSRRRVAGLARHQTVVWVISPSRRILDGGLRLGGHGGPAGPEPLRKAPEDAGSLERAAAKDVAGSARFCGLHGMVGHDETVGGDGDRDLDWTSSCLLTRGSPRIPGLAAVTSGGLRGPHQWPTSLREG